MTSQSDTATGVSLERLQELVEQHAGNRSAIARTLTEKDEHPITYQGVIKLLRKHDLTDLADRLAVGSGRSGPRPLTPEEARAEREALLRALHEHSTAAEAMKALGIEAVATFYRRRAKVRDELVRALLSNSGKVAATARELGLTKTALVQGIKSLRIAESEFRPRSKPASKSRRRAK